jgi:hypothetical protein
MTHPLVFFFFCFYCDAWPLSINHSLVAVNLSEQVVEWDQQKKRRKIMQSRDTTSECFKWNGIIQKRKPSRRNVSQFAAQTNRKRFVASCNYFIVRLFVYAVFLTQLDWMLHDGRLLWSHHGEFCDEECRPNFACFWIGLSKSVSK